MSTGKFTFINGHLRNSMKITRYKLQIHSKLGLQQNVAGWTY